MTKFLLCMTTPDGMSSFCECDTAAEAAAEAEAKTANGYLLDSITEYQEDESGELTAYHALGNM